VIRGRGLDAEDAVEGWTGGWREGGEVWVGGEAGEAGCGERDSVEM
jgi:hypothetical protein